MPGPRTIARRRRVLASLGALVLQSTCSAAGSPVATVRQGPSALAAARGTVYAVDDSRGAIVAFAVAGRPPAASPPRDVVAAPGNGPRPVALAVMASGMLVAVCREDDAWTLRTWEPKPDAAADPSAPLQTVRLGSAAGASGAVRMAVSPTGRWLAVAGLPAPLPPVVRAAVAGRLVGPPSSRNCPPCGGRSPAAVAVSPADELVVCERAAGAGGRTTLAFTSLSGLEILRLDAGLAAVQSMAFDPGSGTLLAVGTRSQGAGREEGLWRLDAAVDGGRQIIRAVPMAALASPSSIVFPTAGLAVVAHAAGTAVVDVSQTAAFAPGASPP